MTEAGSFHRQIGISTLALQDMPLAEAIQRTFEGGFRVFELVPRLYGGPQHFDAQTRRDLRDQFTRFDTVTVHTSGPTLADGRRVNLAASEPSRRHQSVENYLAHLQLALDLGASVVTWHPGYIEAGIAPAQVREANLSFARSAIAEAGHGELQMGYEYFDLTLTREIGHTDFGLLFDIGHAALELERDITSGILARMETLLPHIVQLHVHGVRLLEGGRKQDHVPLQANDAIEYGDVVQAVKHHRFPGPVIFEIENADKYENLRNSILGREALLSMWGES